MHSNLRRCGLTGSGTPSNGITGKAAGTSSKGQSCLFSSADTSNPLFVNVMSGQDAKGARKIADKYYAQAAAAYGTLCNIVYGNGNTAPDLGTLISEG